jgi:hypothetical protein
MYNWSTDEEQLKKDPDYYHQWELEQLINFGLGGKKLNAETLKKYWKKLRIDPARRRFLEVLIYGDSHSQQKSNSVF